MRAVAAVILALMLAGMASTGCRNKHRYDGTCKVDEHCLEFQKCVSGVCIRKEPIFKPYEPPPTPAPQAARKRKPRPPEAPEKQQLEEPKQAPAKAAPVKQELGPAVPRGGRKDGTYGRKFRLDA